MCGGGGGERGAHGVGTGLCVCVCVAGGAGRQLLSGLVTSWCVATAKLAAVQLQLASDLAPDNLDVSAHAV